MGSNRVILNVMLGRGAGGLENVFVQHTLNFQELGYQSIAVCHPKSPYVEQLRAAGIKTFIMRNNWWDVRAWAVWVCILKRCRPDVVCMHGNRAIAFGITKWIRLFIRPFPKLIATTHNARNKRFKHLDGCFAITRVLEKSLTNDFGIPSSKVFYCPNAVKPLIEGVRNKVLHKPFTFGFLGRFHPVKGCDILLEACAKLKAQGVLFKVEIAGDGTLKEVYQQRAAALGIGELVNFCGWVEDKVEFFNRINVLCMPSRSEALPISLLESLSAATPVIVSACPGMCEIVEGNACGLIVPIENVNALTDAMNQMVNTPYLWETFSQGAVSLFNAKYTIEQQKVCLKEGVLTICAL